MNQRIDAQAIRTAVLELGETTRAEICWHLGTNDRVTVGQAMTEAHLAGLIQRIPDRAGDTELRWRAAA